MQKNQTVVQVDAVLLSACREDGSGVVIDGASWPWGLNEPYLINNNPKTYKKSRLPKNPTMAFAIMTYKNVGSGFLRCKGL